MAFESKSDDLDRDMDSIRKENRDEAERIFDFLSLLTSLYDRDKQRYIKSFVKHVYRWARMSSYHQLYFGQTTDDQKIKQLMSEFSAEFNKKYLPPIEHTLFYEIYPSKPLRAFIQKHQPKRTVSPSPPLNLAPVPLRTQKVLFLMDWDDTLIPSTMIRHKQYNITDTNTSVTKRAELDHYCEALDHFMGTIFALMNYNSDRNVQILTNGSSRWVKEESLFDSGDLFARKMTPFAEKLCKYHIDIISASDNWMTAAKYDKARGNHYKKVEPYKWKWKIMKQLFREYFGKRLDGRNDIKIVSLGDSYQSEYLGAGVAFSSYLEKQSMKKTKDIDMSLHRIKFIEEPTVPQLTKQLEWCAKHMKSIVIDG
eukprot:127580_1